MKVFTVYHVGTLAFLISHVNAIIVSRNSGAASDCRCFKEAEKKLQVLKEAASNCRCLRKQKIDAIFY